MPLALTTKLKYKWNLLKNRVSDQQIREVFNYLAETEIDDFITLENINLKIMASGGFVHLTRIGPAPGEFIVRTTGAKQESIYAEKTQDLPRTVILEFGSAHKTNWHPIYRSDSYCTDLSFYYLMNAARTEILRLHEKLMGPLELLGLSRGSIVLDDVRFSRSGPGFELRSLDDESAFLFLSFGEAVRRIAQEEKKLGDT